MTRAREVEEWPDADGGGAKMLKMGTARSIQAAQETEGAD